MNKEEKGVFWGGLSLLALMFIVGAIGVNWWDIKHGYYNWQNERVLKIIQEACASYEFDKAHSLLPDLNETKYYDSCRAEVFKKESLYLMSQDNDAAKKRIIYLLKEEGNNNGQVEMLMDLAIENDDEAFVKTLVNQFQKGYNGKGITAMIDYLSKKDTKEAKDYIRKYATDHFSLRSNTLVDLFVATNDKNDADFIIGKLTEEESTITKRPKMGKTSTNSMNREEFNEQCEKYSNSVKRYNELCQKILGIAIKNKNLYLAQRVASKFKTNILIESPNYYGFLITTDNNEVNAAKATLKEAIRSGAFK